MLERTSGLGRFFFWRRSVPAFRTSYPGALLTEGQEIVYWNTRIEDQTVPVYLTGERITLWQRQFQDLLKYKLTE
ncbi:hypothetical protein EV586_103146 [Tumebacillus sp. BK434]|nr:hypothetical protein EV586_103146 [Tumebacillus sp. BK434]